MKSYGVTYERCAISEYVRSAIADREVDVRQPGIASILIEQSRISRVDL